MIGPRNSVRGRLVALLKALGANSPELGFGQYVVGGEPDWSRIVLAGFSQGGGNIGYIGTKHATVRAIYFSTPLGSARILTEQACTSHEECTAIGEEVCDDKVKVCATLEPAPWSKLPRVMPPDREWSLLHVDEGSWHFSRTCYELWGMDACGPVMAVEDTAPDFGCSHLLSTRATPDDDSAAHPSIGSDNAMAKDADALPVNQRALVYLFGAGW